MKKKSQEKVYFSEAFRHILSSSGYTDCDDTSLRVKNVFHFLKKLKYETNLHMKMVKLTEFCSGLALIPKI